MIKINPNLIWDYDIPAKQDTFFKRWYIARVLMRGGVKDIRQVNVQTIRRHLPYLSLPKRIRAFWEWYFQSVYEPKKDRHSYRLPKRRS